MPLPYLKLVYTLERTLGIFLVRGLSHSPITYSLLASLQSLRSITLRTFKIFLVYNQFAY